MLFLGPILLKTSNQEVILEILIEVKRGAGKRETIVLRRDKRWTTHTVAGDNPANNWMSKRLYENKWNYPLVRLSRCSVDITERTKDTRDWGWEKRTRCKDPWVYILSFPLASWLWVIQVWVIRSHMERSTTFFSLGCVPYALPSISDLLWGCACETCFINWSCMICYENLPIRWNFSCFIPFMVMMKWLGDFSLILPD